VTVYTYILILEKLQRLYGHISKLTFTNKIIVKFLAIGKKRLKVSFKQRQPHSTIHITTHSIVKMITWNKLNVTPISRPISNPMNTVHRNTTIHTSWSGITKTQYVITVCILQ